MTTTPKKPDRTFTLKVDGADTEIVMSFALFQEVMKLIPSPEDITSLLLEDFHLREFIVRRVLTGRKRVREDSDMVDLFEVELEDDEVENMILWVTDHILYFFTTTVQRTVQLGEKYKGVMKDLTQSVPSQAGSPT